MTSASAPERRSGHSILAPFVAIGLVFLVTNLVAIIRSREVRSTTRLIVENMVASIELVSRMGRDITDERLLVDAHIFEKKAVEMDRVERDIASVQSDFAAATQAYEPLATLPNEAGAWQRLRADVAAIRGPMAAALVLSRDNRDADARRAMFALEPRFEEVRGDTASLIAINRTAAERAVARVESLQRSSVSLHTGLAFIGVIITVFAGAWAKRLVDRREEEHARYSALLVTQNRELDAFAGRVAHDLRGPLTSISLAAERLDRSSPSGSGIEAILKRGVGRMETLIADLLALSRVEAPGRLSRCDPVLAVDQVREELAARAEPDSALLRVQMEPATLACGMGLLRQVLWNLTDNAVKYGRPSVPVEIEIWGQVVGDSYRLRLADNGIGMSPDETRQAFEPFFRALRSPGAPGTGLGLSIVKRIIEACGGTIFLTSQLGRGTTFTIDLPLANTDPPPRGQTLPLDT